jgi:uncharacterized delta-60 repeat protein
MKTVSLIFFVCLSIKAYTQPGTLDRNFGDTGIALNKTLEGTINIIGLQSDAKIIAAGGGSINGSLFLLARYNVDGTIDSSFGSNGVTGNTELSFVFGMAIDKSDAIIALGHTAKDIKLAKFKKDGGLDKAFGNGGTIVTNVEDNDVPVEVLMQPDGKILVGGYSINAENEPRDAFLIRYLPDGNLDKSFGDKGIRILDSISDPMGLFSLNAIGLQNDGKILAATYNLKPYLYRFNADGSIDKNFGSKGEAYFQPTDADVKSFQPYDIAVQPDGKIIGGGSAVKKGPVADSYMAAACLNADGSKDSSFGTNGIIHVLFNQDYSKATKVLLQADNKIILSGWAHDEYSTYIYLALTRLKPDGTTDSSFGENGQTKTTVEGMAVSNDGLLQADGKILVGGSTFIGDFSGKSYFVLARYNNDLTKKQILITKIKKWLQHHNGFTWDNNNNISSYTVQRSYDGIHFNSVARINAGSQSNLTYQDPMPLSGPNYYRLQTTSISGAVANSNVIVVTNDALNVSLAPNPAKNTLFITGLPANQKVKLIVVDFSGNVKLQALANTSSYNLNISSLHAGNYVIKMDINGEVVSKQFVKE